MTGTRKGALPFPGKLGFWSIMFVPRKICSLLAWVGLLLNARKHINKTTTFFITFLFIYTYYAIRLTENGCKGTTIQINKQKISKLRIYLEFTIL